MTEPASPPRRALVGAALLLGALLLAVLLLAGALRLGSGLRPLAAGEVDALAGGSRLAAELDGGGEASGDGGEASGSLAKRLARGFEPTADHPRGERLSGGRQWRLAYADPPLPRWLAGLSILGAPGGGHDLARARWGASLALSAAAVLAGWLLAGMVGARRRRARIGWTALGAGLVATSPGAVDAAAGPGAEAVAALAAVLLLAAARPVVAGGEGGRARGGWLLGLAWGGALAVYPAALLLVVPLLAAAAIHRRADPGVPAEAGQLRLPAVPLGLLAAPLVALVVLVALWPAAWSEPTRALVAWLTEPWWYRQPVQEVAGAVYDQSAGAGPPFWTALLQWTGWTTVPVLAAWSVGLVETVRRGRDGPWLPVLVLATLVAVGGVQGGLFGARTSLLPWLWGPIALTAGLGVATLARVARARWPRLRAAPTAAALAAAVLAAPATGAALQRVPARASAAGAVARKPAPHGWLREMARVTPGRRVHVVAGSEGWARAIRVLRRHADLRLRAGGADASAWLLVVADGSKAVEEVVAKRLERREPAWKDRIAGVWMRGYEVR